jgi:hypothetical protein
MRVIADATPRLPTQLAGAFARTWFNFDFAVADVSIRAPKGNNT